MQKDWKKIFWIIYIGQAFSILGSSAVQFAIIWWLTIQTESAVTLTVAAIVGFLPNMLIGPFAGVWVDRFNRRTVMMIADSFVALSSALLAVAFLWNSAPPIGLIYFVLFLRGLGSTFHTPAMQAAIPMLVPPEMLTRTGGWGNLIFSISNMFGPVIGALLMGIWSLPAVILVDIVGAAFAVLCLGFIKIPDLPQRTEKPTVLADLKLGLSAARANKPLMTVFVPMLLCNIVFMPLGSLYPLMVRTHFAGEAWHNSVVEVVFAAGLLVSSLVLGVWGGLKRRFLMVSLSFILLGVATLVSGTLPSTAFWPFTVCCFFMGFSGTFVNVPLMAYTQETIPQEVLGKVMSLLMTAMTLAMPLGLLLAGPLSEWIGVDRWFFYSGGAILLTGFLCRAMTKKYDDEFTQKDKTSETI